MTTPQQTALEACVSAFRPFAERMAGSDSTWIHQQRKAAMASLRETGFPTIKDEEWKFTNLAPLLATPFRHGTEPGRTPETLPAHVLLDEFPHRLVFLDGHYTPRLSRSPEHEEDAAIFSLASAMEEWPRELERQLGVNLPPGMNSFVTLNTAFFQDGAYIRVPDGVRVAEPVYLLFIQTSPDAPAASHVRNIVLAGKDSSVSIIEHHVSLDGGGASFMNVVTEIVAGPGGRVEHLKVQTQDASAFHIGAILAHQFAGSRFVSHSISAGAHIARNDIVATLMGEGAETILNGLYLGEDHQLVDHHTRVDHAKPHCASHEFYHGILDGQSHGVFNGKIYVHPDAQKTDAKQTNRNLLLTDDAVIDTKPQLEIYADDVKCTHGATVGQLDDEALFYLRSRGIGHDTARQMLIHAFASDILNRIPFRTVRDTLEELIQDRFRPAALERVN